MMVPEFQSLMEEFLNDATKLPNNTTHNRNTFSNVQPNKSSVRPSESMHSLHSNSSVTVGGFSSSSSCSQLSAYQQPQPPYAHPYTHNLPPSSNNVPLRAHSFTDLTKEQHKYIFHRLQEIQSQRQQAEIEEAAFFRVKAEEQRQQRKIEDESLADWPEKSNERDEWEDYEENFDPASSTQRHSVTSPSHSLTETLCSESRGEESINTVTSTNRNGTNSNSNVVNEMNHPNHSAVPLLMNLNSAGHVPNQWCFQSQQIALPRPQPVALRTVTHPIQSYSSTAAVHQRLPQVQYIQQHPRIPVLSTPSQHAQNSAPSAEFSDAQNEASQRNVIINSSNNLSSRHRSASQSSCLQEISQRLCLSLQHSLNQLDAQENMLQKELQRQKKDEQLLKKKSQLDLAKMRAKIAIFKAENQKLRAVRVAKSMDEARKLCVHVA